VSYPDGRPLATAAAQTALRRHAMDHTKRVEAEIEFKRLDAIREQLDVTLGRIDELRGQFMTERVNVQAKMELLQCQMRTLAK
jgi:hypothetical protein